MKNTEEPNYISYASNETGFFQVQSRFGIDDIPEVHSDLAAFQTECPTSFFGFGKEHDAEDRDLKPEKSGMHLTLMPLDTLDNTCRTELQSDSYSLTSKRSAENISADKFERSGSEEFSTGPVSKSDLEFNNSNIRMEVSNVKKGTDSDKLDEQMQEVLQNRDGSL
eukprot:CAMPEP_0176452956 /NCGR_PEP_ID=MMETSP0127-20121128/28901_1 /TAXON_ID=938130 /ORGANISM="Platyophrya macrostoma, Strain WH" /LENGTH=165 /DNA_ID=CAMNT_0017841623 /DNA_START=30 /DNA_END=526 /DNA_ORIENTATION=+